MRARALALVATSMLSASLWGCQPTAQQVILSAGEGEETNLCPSAPPALPYLDGPDARAPEEIASAIQTGALDEVQPMLESKAEGEPEAWVHLALGDVRWRRGDREGAAQQWRAGLDARLAPPSVLQPSAMERLAALRERVRARARL